MVVVPLSLCVKLIYHGFKLFKNSISRRDVIIFDELMQRRGVLNQLHTR